MNRRFLLFSFGSIALLATVSIAHAADPAPITISVKGMTEPSSSPPTSHQTVASRPNAAKVACMTLPRR